MPFCPLVLLGQFSIVFEFRCREGHCESMSGPPGPRQSASELSLVPHCVPTRFKLAPPIDQIQESGFRDCDAES
ncbi:hypothetical protein BDW74DRAFT_152901 [Aspergillus multicolor]|uniref:uncharacterized protein n=1 Tax=Aspergillus multicolor TaxID=41759 RepID=UPI003CCC9B68